MAILIHSTLVSDYETTKLMKWGNTLYLGYVKERFLNGDEQANWKQPCAKLFTPEFLSMSLQYEELYYNMVLYTKKTSTLCCCFPHSQFITVIYDAPNRHSNLIVNSSYEHNIVLNTCFRNLRFVVKSKELYSPTFWIFINVQLSCDYNGDFEHWCF